MFTEAKPSTFVPLQVHADISNLLGHAFRKSAAGAFGPDLAKKLSQLVKMEKNVMRSMELVGRERMEVAVSIAAYVCAEKQTLAAVT
jgi:BMFP domain-containing protein YqiC